MTSLNKNRARRAFASNHVLHKFSFRVNINDVPTHVIFFKVKGQDGYGCAVRSNEKNRWGRVTSKVMLQAGWMVTEVFEDMQDHIEDQGWTHRVSELSMYMYILRTVQAHLE